ncbi:GTPase GPN2 [Sporobolomyces koalae]|uniref:GTPase GPN2 n=1 Tax=Sporobolomyces koalae TaxID=500713 RepID=UPI0031714897
MPFGQIVIGPPGSGKTTYCWGLYQFFQALSRPIILINLDPASKPPPYPHSLDISSLISLDDCMREFGLGPNGAMLYCLEYLEQNLDWFETELDKVLDQALADQPPTTTTTRRWRREEMYVVFDTPGQVELSTNHQSLKNVLNFLEKKLDFRLAAVQLIDSSHILDPAKYIAVLLLALRTMLQLELPHINVLSKIDILSMSGDLPFNLDFYTEVQDLSHLLPLLASSHPRMERFAELNEKIVELVEEFGLVSFETLAVEDKESMLSLVATIDQSLGYLPPPAPPAATTTSHSHEHDDHGHDHSHSALPTMPAHVKQSVGLKTATVQEKWIDSKRGYEAFEHERWEREGDRVRKEANRRERRQAGVTEEEYLDQLERHDEEGQNPGMVWDGE